MLTQPDSVVMYDGSTSVRRIECKAVLVPEEEGGFSVYASRLPGVVSEGDTREEAIENVKEAFRLAVHSYEARGLEVPFTDQLDVDPAGIQVWVVVDV